MTTDQINAILTECGYADEMYYSVGNTQPDVLGIISADGIALFHRAFAHLSLGATLEQLCATFSDEDLLDALDHFAEETIEAYIAETECWSDDRAVIEKALAVHAPFFQSHGLDIAP